MKEYNESVAGIAGDCQMKNYISLIIGQLKKDISLKIR